MGCRVNIKGYAGNKQNRPNVMIYYRVRNDGKETIVKTNGKWIVGDIIDEIVRGLKK